MVLRHPAVDPSPEAAAAAAVVSSPVVGSSRISPHTGGRDRESKTEGRKLSCPVAMGWGRAPWLDGYNGTWTGTRRVGSPVVGRRIQRGLTRPMRQAKGICSTITQKTDCLLRRRAKYGIGLPGVSDGSKLYRESRSNAHSRNRRVCKAFSLHSRGSERSQGVCSANWQAHILSE